jgi:CobQ-like glutamine amidotransferase family enzyme
MKAGLDSKPKMVIGWLYPRQMSTYGDRGNILTLYRRCKWRNIEVEVREINLDEQVNPAQIDLFFFGGGQDQAQKIISNDLQTKGADLKRAARLGSVFLGVCGGYQLLGNYYRTSQGTEIAGLGLLDISTIAGKKRLIGNLLAELNPSLGVNQEKNIVGFENHSGKTYLGKKASPLSQVIIGAGNNGEDRTEGAFQDNVFGCYLHGPVLPKNPSFADFLIKRALLKHYPAIQLAKLDDHLEESAHKVSSERTRNTKRLSVS